MTKYLISFPSAAMVLTPDELEAAGRDSRAVVAEAKAAGVWVFGGGIDESIPPVTVGADGNTTEGTHQHTAHLEGGYTVLELADYSAALEWAAKLAEGCHTPQEVRAFMYDPES